MYIVYSFVDTKVLPDNVALYASSFHLFILAPVLFFIFLLTYRKKFDSLGVAFLMINPVLGAIGNLIIVSHAPEFNAYLVETYLIVFWLFTLSGLSFKKASICVFLILLFTIVYNYFYISLSLELLILHSFWLFCSISFGLLVAFLIFRQNKLIFENHDNLKKSIFTDELTQIYNRKKIEDFLPQEILRCQRFNRTFAFIMIDIDHFKEVNTLYGHNVGDVVLKEVVQQIQKHLRQVDVFLRWGGEEFVLVCLETNKEKIVSLLEKIKDDIQNTEFTEIGNRTISIGLTDFQKNDTLEDLLKRADEALYDAKNSGRNTIKIL